MAKENTRRAVKSEENSRERLLRLLRLTASNQDGEALAALRKAAQLMERMALDWEDLVQGPAPSLEVLAEAVAVGRASGLRQARAEAAKTVKEAARRAYADGLSAGRARARAELGCPPHRFDDEPIVSDPDVVDLDRRRDEARQSKNDEDWARIAAVLDNPRTPPHTVAFIEDLGRWLDTRGPLTPAQRAALERTHRRWGRGAA